MLVATLLRFLGAGLVTTADGDGFVFTPFTTFAAPANTMSQSTREIQASFFHHSKPFQNQELLQRSRSLNSPHSLKPVLHKGLWTPLAQNTPLLGCWMLCSQKLNPGEPYHLPPSFPGSALRSLWRAFPLPLPLFPRGSTLPVCLYSETSGELRGFAFHTVGPDGQTAPSMISLGSFKTLPTPGSVLKSPRAMIFKGHALYLLGKVAALG